MTFNIPQTTTKDCPYAKYLEATGTLQFEHIQQLATVRSKLQVRLNEEGSTKHTLSSFQEYFPLLFSLLRYLEREGTNAMRSRWEFTWRSSLSIGIRKLVTSQGTSKPKFTIDSLYFEVTYVLLGYGFTLNNMATKSCMNIKLPEGEAQLNQAADWLCQAAGIYQFASDNIITRWVNLPSKRPPEIMRESLLALSEVSIGDAQYLAIKKGISKGMKANTLAKLSLGVHEKFQKADHLVHQLKHDYDDFSVEFQHYLTAGALFYRALACFLMAQDYYERQSKNGIAVGLMGYAHAIWTRCKEEFESETVHGLVDEYFPECERLYRMYCKVNDTVSFEAVPSNDELHGFLPESTIIFQPKVMPQPDLIF